MEVPASPAQLPELRECLGAFRVRFRRLVVRFERLITTSAGFFHLACAFLTLRRVLQ
jgi:hypothetical protein